MPVNYELAKHTDCCKQTFNVFKISDNPLSPDVAKFDFLFLLLGVTAAVLKRVAYTLHFRILPVL